MSYKTDHYKLGEIEVLIEAEIDHANSHLADCNVIEGKKYFALVKSKYKPVERGGWSFERDIKWKIRSAKAKDNYYILWGNTDDFNQMGVTHMITDKLNPIQGKTKLVNMFFEMIRSSKFMTFKK